MAAKRSPGTRAETIHCDICGEDYAVTYKRCPFCDGRPPAEDGEGASGRRGGGRRLANNTRGGGYGGGPSPLKIAGTVISLALIIAAVCIVISIIKPLVDKGNVTMPDPTDQVSPSPDATTDPTTEPTGEPGTETTQPPEETVPATQTATGFTLNQSDFTMNDSYPNPVTIGVTFIPAGTTGTITWTSSDPDVVSVDENGTVSHGTKTGSATITASMPGAEVQTCLVRNGVTKGTTSGGSSSSSGSSTSSGGSTSSGSLSLNHTDFTFSSASDPTVYMKVNGTSSTPTWSIGNTSVATISADGAVKPVGRGTTTITCKVDGKTLECIVRCSW